MPLASLATSHSGHFTQQPDFPEQYICTLTGSVMLDPVQDNNGHVYERAAIVRVLSRDPRSPITRTPLTVQDLRPADSVRNAIAADAAALQEAQQAAQQRQVEGHHAQRAQPLWEARQLRQMEADLRRDYGHEAQSMRSPRRLYAADIPAPFAAGILATPMRTRLREPRSQAWQGPWEKAREGWPRLMQ